MVTTVPIRRLLLSAIPAVVLSSIVAAADPAPSTTDLPDEIAPPRFVAAWGSEGTGDGQFKAPIGIAINAADEVFVTDAPTDRVQRFTADGKFLEKLATGSFPGGIAIDRDGLVYVAVMMSN
jgi:hypothetical protein